MNSSEHVRNKVREIGLQSNVLISQEDMLPFYDNQYNNKSKIKIQN